MSGLANRVSAELKLGYLAAVVVALFLFPYPTTIAVLLLLQAFLWVSSSLGWRPLRRIFLRLSIFFIVIGVSYSFFSLGDPGADRWTTLALGPWTMEINLAGLVRALMMCLRVSVLVVASAWVQQSGKPGEFVRALENFRVPRFLAASIDGTLQLVVGSGGQGGRVERDGGRSAATAHRLGRVGLDFRRLVRSRVVHRGDSQPPGYFPVEPADAMG